jgi:23S rRNA pseudouridine1911/1915/1917 synthase
MVRETNYDKARVGLTDEGSRLDTFLSGCPEVRSRSNAQALIESGAVTVNGAIKAKNHRLRLGDVIEYQIPAEPPETVEPENIPLTVIYEDDDLIVIDKPAGMVVHPAAGNFSGTLVNALLAHTRLASLGSPLRPGIVHRLDKGTSGLLVAAKTDDAYLSLVEQLRKRQVNREYLALVEGGFADVAGRIEAPIRRHPKDRKMMAVGGHEAKEAVTNFKVLAAAAGLTLLQINLETGRTHQIRVHMKFIKHPIVGDPVYGRPAAARKFGIDRPWLHARRLSFKHPRDGRELEFNSAVPAELSEVLTRIGLDWE